MKTRIFTPIHKHDRIRCAYLGADSSAIVLYERSTPLGTQHYAQVSTGVPNLTVCLRSTARSTSLHRIVLHDPGIVAVPLATGRHVTIDAYEDNGSEATRAAGKYVTSLYVNVRGIGGYHMSDIYGFLGGGFTIQSTGSRYGFDVAPLNAAYLRESCRQYFDSDTRVLRFEDNAPPVESSAA